MPGEDCRQFEAGGAACQQFDRHLAAYLEGEDGSEVLAHAQQCPYCGTLLADMEQIRFASRHLPLDEPPARVWANIRAALQAEGILREQVPAWYRRFPRLAILPRPVPLGAFACLALLALTFL
jgi:anti-sigma factor RsiW